MSDPEKDTVDVKGGARSGLSSAVYTPQDNLSVKSKDEQAEAEEGIEEAFGPARDEEEGFHQHGGNHVHLSDPSIVDFDGPNDPENPQNWSLGLKIWVR
jgi:MFS transporter, DHA1 family, multidrug resistance protein